MCMECYYRFEEAWIRATPEKRAEVLPKVQKIIEVLQRRSQFHVVPKREQTKTENGGKHDGPK